MHRHEHNANQRGNSPCTAITDAKCRPCKAKKNKNLPWSKGNIHWRPHLKTCVGAQLPFQSIISFPFLLLLPTSSPVFFPLSLFPSLLRATVNGSAEHVNSHSRSWRSPAVKRHLLHSGLKTVLLWTTILVQFTVDYIWAASSAHSHADCCYITL